jgi:adenosylcobinamide kinase/adenosylcobinamide-phosphate guanylyltransferase
MRAEVGFVFLVGGARSGKSRLAQTLAAEASRSESVPVCVVATATAGDDDMAARIRRHQAERPPEWELVEAPIELAEALGAIEGRSIVVVDCLTLWVANLMFDDRPDTGIEAATSAVADLLAARTGPSIVVSNEVGSGVHPPSELGRRYQDLLGRVNQIMAARAGRSLLVVAGLALPLAPPADVLTGWLYHGRSGHGRSGHGRPGHGRCG